MPGTGLVSNGNRLPLTDTQTKYGTDVSAMTDHHVRISNVRAATLDEWHSHWNACEYATYFHSPEWASIWATYTDDYIRPAPKLISFSDGKKAILPFSLQKRCKGTVTTYLSSPEGTFGGWISSDDLTRRHGILLRELLTHKFSSLRWKVNPYDTLAREVIAQNNCSNGYDETDALSLTEGFSSICDLWRTGHGTAMRNVKKAHEHGVTVDLALTQDDWLSYYAVYQDTLRRWGTNASSTYTWKLFSTISALRSPNIKLWLARYQSTTIAGALVFYAKKHVVYWHGAARADYFNVRPVNLLMYEAIRDACGSGFSWFDFNPSDRHEGVRAFKKGLRAEALPCPTLKIDHPIPRLVTHLARSVKHKSLGQHSVRRMLNEFPLSLGNLAESKVKLMDEDIEDVPVQRESTRRAR